MRARVVRHFIPCRSSSPGSHQGTLDQSQSTLVVASADQRAGGVDETPYARRGQHRCRRVRADDGGRVGEPTKPDQPLDLDLHDVGPVACRHLGQQRHRLREQLLEPAPDPATARPRRARSAPRRGPRGPSRRRAGPGRSGRSAATPRDGRRRCGTGDLADTKRRRAPRPAAAPAPSPRPPPSRPGVRPGPHLLELKPEPTVPGRVLGGQREQVGGLVSAPTERACAAAAAQASAAALRRPAAARWCATSTRSSGRGRQPPGRAARPRRRARRDRGAQQSWRKPSRPSRQTSRPSEAVTSSAGAGPPRPSRRARHAAGGRPPRAARGRPPSRADPTDGGRDRRTQVGRGTGAAGDEGPGRLHGEQRVSLGGRDHSSSWSPSSGGATEQGPRPPIGDRGEVDVGHRDGPGDHVGDENVELGSVNALAASQHEQQRQPARAACHVGRQPQAGPVGAVRVVDGHSVGRSAHDHSTSRSSASKTRSLSSSGAVARGDRLCVPTARRGPGRAGSAPPATRRRRHAAGACGQPLRQVQPGRERRLAGDVDAGRHGVRPPAALDHVAAARSAWWSCRSRPRPRPPPVGRGHRRPPASSTQLSSSAARPNSGNREGRGSLDFHPGVDGASRRRRAHPDLLLQPVGEGLGDDGRFGPLAGAQQAVQ